VNPGDTHPFDPSQTPAADSPGGRILRSRVDRRRSFFPRLLTAGLPALGLGAALLLADDAGPQPLVTRQTDGDVLVQLSVPAGQFQRVETSTDFQTWNALATVSSNGTAQYRDSGAVYKERRYYRFVAVPGTGIFTGDHLQTSAGDVVIKPINHASFVLQWDGKTIYCDPVGAASLYSGIPLADLMLVTHSHSDHYSATTLTSQKKATGTVIIAPQAVYTGMNATLKPLTTPLANGGSTTAIGMTIDAIPAYNLTNTNHVQGAGNGYILTIGGKRIYLSGDSEDIPEMRNLQNIDVAFVCMNTPYTMNVTKAISTVRQFKPKVVYPYHYRNSDNTYADLPLFKAQVGSDLGIEVRQRAWY
jgi:L-ascorbate metabolism protein UlaG (beta-lactamase superfamily)